MHGPGDLALDSSWLSNLGIHDVEASEVYIPLHEGLKPLVVPQGGESQSSTGTAGFVWNAGIVLARFLSSGVLALPLAASAADSGDTAGATDCLGTVASAATGASASVLPPLRCVELGAGTGVCSAALAQAAESWSLSCKSQAACTILATDLPAATALARATLRLNSLGGVVDVAPLDWREAAAARETSDAWARLSTAELVFGADITYSDELLALVFGVLRGPCSLGSAAALLAHEHRGNADEFEALLATSAGEAGLEWVRLPKGLAPGPDDVVIYLLARRDARVLGSGGRLRRLAEIGGWRW